MTPIEVGDLSLAKAKATLQEQLFHAIRHKIVTHLWPLGGKLPSTRKLSVELSLSRNTVIAAYEQLAAEGYIESRAGSGYYVAIELPESYLSKHEHQPKVLSSPAQDINRLFAPGVPDLQQFPVGKWQRMLQRHSTRLSLLGNQAIQGSLALREALASYLASSRSVRCDPQRIIITSGAQQALYIALNAVLERNDGVLMEQPGYAQMSKVIALNGFKFKALPVAEKRGFALEDVFHSDAKALYVTPSNQYPMGTTLSSEQRLQLVEWAAQHGRWIIEDDYDSEFQFAHRPYTSLQGLASEMGGGDRVVYIGSFSKVMFNGLRLGYMVVPDALVEACLAVKDATSGDTPTHTQEALADFINEGDLLRHIRKMRRLYKQKHQCMSESISRHFGDRVEIISQAAGLHVTLKWLGGIEESTFVERAREAGIIVRPMSYYEHSTSPDRAWRGVVLGFGNVAMKEIEPNIQRLAKIFGV